MERWSIANSVQATAFASFDRPAWRFGAFAGRMFSVLSFPSSNGVPGQGFAARPKPPLTRLTVWPKILAIRRSALTYRSGQRFLSSLWSDF
jgi:hypothetical protein